MEKTYDCLIIGGGYAGLSAAIYLARYNRSVLVLDNEDGRWNSYEINQNYLGFPHGIPSKGLRNLGLEQAKNYKAIFQQDTIINIFKKDNSFVCSGATQTYHGKTIIIATGVRDHFPHFPHWKDYIGKSLFWCITCDGYKTIGKRIVIVGKNDDAACNAMQFLSFTKQITFVTNSPEHSISEVWKTRMAGANIPFYSERITKEFGHNGMFEKIILESGKEISFDYMFSEQDPVPKSELAVMLGVTVNEKGYITTNLEQRTNIPHVYAAGDITKLFDQQIVSAVYQGAAAAEAANYDLYATEQKSL